ncbi:MAG: hypothetical protein AAF405_09645, partial [Pseudomonadota bacterium]
MRVFAWFTFLFLAAAAAAPADERADCTQRGNWEAKLAACSALLEANPNNVETLIERGIARKETSDFDGAFADLNKA